MRYFFIATAFFASIVSVAFANGLEVPRLRQMGVGDPIQIENTFSDFPKGELIGALVFKKAWIEACPEEDCVILTASSTKSGRTYVSGVAIYTKSGRVLAHSDRFGNVPLEDLSPSDLSTGEDMKMRKAMQRAVSGLERRPISPSTQGNDFWLIAAQKALSTANKWLPEAGGFTPSRIAGLTTQMMESQDPVNATPWLVFDWNDWHCFYRADAGVVATQVPTHPVTKQPLICIPCGDFLESAVFCGDFRKLNPQEDAVVVFKADTSKVSQIEPGSACAVYTEKGKLYLFSPAFGKFALDGIQVTEIRNFEKLRSAHDGIRKKAVVSRGMSFPESLPGDSIELAIARAHRHFLSINNSSGVYRRNGSIPVLRSYTDRTEFSYDAGTRATAFGGFRKSDGLLPNRLLVGINTGAEYAKNNPSEVVKILTAIDRGRKHATITVASQGATVIGLTDDKTGFAVIKGVSASRLKSDEPRGMFNELLNQRVRGGAETAFSMTYPEKRDDPRDTIALVEQTLNKAGIRYKEIPKTIERQPDGRIKTFPIEAVTFELAGMPFIYSADTSCMFSTGVVYRD